MTAFLLAVLSVLKKHAVSLIKQLKQAIRNKRCWIAVNFGIITFLGAIVFRNFLFTQEWPGGGDVLGWISRSYLYGQDVRWLYIWHEHSFGFVEGINFLDFIFQAIYFLWLNSQITIKIFMCCSFLMAGFSTYAFGYRFTHNHLAALSASLIYTLNPWFVSQLTEAHVRLIFGYALAPIIFLLLDKAVRTASLKDILLLSCGLALFITAFHPISVAIYGAFFLLFLVIYVLSSKGIENFRGRAKHLIKVLLISTLVSFALSAFWWIPFFFNVRSTYYSTVAYPIEDAYIHSYNSIFEAFTLSARESWGYIKVVDVTTGLAFPGLPAFSIRLFLFFLAYCTLISRRDKYSIFFGVSSVLSAFLAKGPYPPLGDIFIWAWKNVPYFDIFRAASRWVMMGALCHSFFISILVSALVDQVQRIGRLRRNEMFTTIRNIGFRKRVFYHVGPIILVFILMIGPGSCWFLFSQGLQTYTPPQSYIEPYEWIAKQSGDFKVVTVGDSSDFASAGMSTDLGMGHDIGYESSFIHDKPTLQDGGWEPLSRAFVNYLRYAQRYNMTDSLMKMLGAFSYRYLILPTYANPQTRDFFLNQKGLQVVYNQTFHDQNALILENDYYVPHVFSAQEHMTIIGGLEAYTALDKVDINFNETAFIFADQLGRSYYASASFNSSLAAVFVNSDLLDLAMLSLPESCLIDAGKYGENRQNSREYWVKSDSWRNSGKFVVRGLTLTTSSRSCTDIPFTVQSEGIHEIWVRVGFAPNRGTLNVSVDDVLIGSIQPHAEFWSELKWLNFTRLDLSTGSHTITLTNNGAGYNDVDAFAIATPSGFESAYKRVLDVFRGFSGRIVYALDAQTFRTHDNSSEWFTSFSPYNGFLLQTEGAVNISLEGNASSSSTEGQHAAGKANDGKDNTRWTSDKSIGLPQWLQIEWASPREIVAVHIQFEQANAENYVIQTWDGARWLNQSSIQGNTALEQFHYFPQPARTTKMRVYVTSAPKFNMVSIGEFESYTNASFLSAKIHIAREGRYVFATRIASDTGPSHFGLRISNITRTISCFNSDSTLRWREIGVFDLDAGDHTISAWATDHFNLDQILIYSLEKKEAVFPPDWLFKSTPVANISYREIKPTLYEIHIKNEEPFLLVFSESYNPLWKLSIGNQDLNPTCLYSVVNGFAINQIGDFKVTIYFEGQTYANIGLVLSASTSLVILTGIVLISVGPKRVLRWVRA